MMSRHHHYNCYLPHTFRRLQQHQQMQSLQSYTIALSFCLLCWMTTFIVPVLGMPYMLLESPKARCVSVEGPQSTVLRVQYDALDYDVDDKETHAFVTVNVVPARRVLDTVLHNSPVKDRLKPSMEVIQAKNGTIMHRFELDGIANICFRSNSASKKFPQRFGFRLETSENDPRMLLPKGEGNSTANVEEHLSHMERELQRITIAMNHVLREADFNKDQDTLFHKQTLAMHSATTFWPIVQVCILLITGFTQTNHIIRFFKSRRII